MDVSLTRIVVIGLVIICCVSTVGIIIVATTGHEPPGSLVALATGTFGVLIGLPINPARNGRSTDNPPPGTVSVSGVVPLQSDNGMPRMSEGQRSQDHRTESPPPS